MRALLGEMIEGNTRDYIKSDKSIIPGAFPFDILIISLTTSFKGVIWM